MLSNLASTLVDFEVHENQVVLVNNIFDGKEEASIHRNHRHDGAEYQAVQEDH